MEAKSLHFIAVLVVLAAIVCGGTAWALDEAILTPTNDSIVPAEEQAFNAAMSIWHRHGYKEGDRLLRAFAARYPNSRWRAEAELHAGCYLAYLENYTDARSIFERLASTYKDSNIRTKATLRLANLAEREANTDNAIEYYAQSMRMNPTWDQFKYANYHARKLMMTRGSREARINCGPVALAACFNALGRTGEAEIARATKPMADGLSLTALEAQARAGNIPAQCVELPIENLKNTTLPVLAHVAPNHFIAILAIENDRAEVEDSIQGKHEESLDSLASKWTGRAIVFTQDVALTPLSFVDSLETTGGCCGQIDEDECLGDPCECSQTGSGGGGSGGSSGGGGGGCGPGSPCLAGVGRPIWQVNVDNLNILVKDTPIFYNPGKGPTIAFTLTYSNENSNTGIFGRGWRSPYDMKVFFLPATIQATTTTTAAVTTGQTSISVNSTSGFSESGAIMLIDGSSSEVMTYSSKTANSFDNITRGPSPISASSGATVDMHTPTFQVHRDNGRIETYEWDDYYQAYKPRSGMANYGYRDTIGYSNGKVVLSLRGGGKYYFRPEGGSAEGRISIIEDQIGNQVTCGYDANGCLDTVTDANGKETAVTTTGTGINERVTEITLPTGDVRTAAFEYTNGNLTSITDMLGDESTLSYDAMLFYTAQASSYTTTAQAITTTFPANGGSILVQSPDYFFSSGKIKINNDEEITYTGKTIKSFTGITRGATPKAASSGSSVVQVAPSTTLSSSITDTSPANGGSLSVADTSAFPTSGWIAVVGSYTECMYYTGKTSTTFTGITRGSPAYAASSGSDVYLCSQSPYLSEIVTPSKKTKFTYEWYDFEPAVPPIVGLHEVYECGPTEDYPSVPTIHYAWCPYQTKETRYPTSVHDSTTNRCIYSGHWSGGLTRTIDFRTFNDATTYIWDELGNQVVHYGYNIATRDRTSVTDASGNTTNYDYGSDGLHNMYSRTDPLYNEWTYTYYTDHSLHTETDPYDHTKTYTYNSSGQVTQIDGPLGTQVINHYDAQGRLDYSTDGRGKTTNYHYNEDGETRGFLTSVHDPEGNATLYHYDAKGRRDQVTDPSGNVTTFEYDNLDRVTKTIHGSGQNDPHIDTEYTCCHKDRVIDENGIATRYVYDRKNRPWVTIAAAVDGLLSADISDSDTSVPLADASGFPVPPQGGHAIAIVQHRYEICPSGCYQYVGLEVIAYTGISGNTLTGVTRAQYGSTAHAFNTNDRVTASKVVNDGVTVGNVTVYGYDSQYLDRMTSLTDALGHTTYYTYYANGKLETTWYPDNKGEKYTYDNSNSGNNMIRKEYGTFSGTYPNQTFTVNNDLTVNYEYDANSRLVRTYH